MKLRLHEVKKSFSQGGREIPVLRGVNLAADSRDQIAVLGRSGSGKSTLLSLLAGLDRADHGEIEVDGRSFSSMDESALTAFRGARVGIVFQQFHLISDLTALENVSLPLELSRSLDAEERAQAALEEVGLAERTRHFARQLSGGECQRVAIARAIVHRPALLLADEPTGNLDDRTAHEISDLLFQVAENAGSVLILVTHSEELGGRCHRQYRLEQGQLRE